MKNLMSNPKLFETIHQHLFPQEAFNLGYSFSIHDRLFEKGGWDIKLLLRLIPAIESVRWSGSLNLTSIVFD